MGASLMPSARDLQRLHGVHPQLVGRVVRLLAAMEMRGAPMCVTDGVRTAAQQAALYAKGRTAPGPRVTNADGVHILSNHQVKPDGYGHAVDCAFLVNGHPSWDARHPWDAYGALAQSLDLEWGGTWKFIDLPHIQLP